MKKAYIGIIILLLMLSSCKSTYKGSDVCYDCGFNTIWNYTLYCDNAESYQNYQKIIHDSAKYYHQLFDIYHNYEGLNNIKTINDYAGIKAVEVDEAIIELLSLAKDIYLLSDGSFDIAQGKLFALWHDYREAGKTLNAEEKGGLLPTESELQNAYNAQAFSHIIIDDENNTVFIDDPNVNIDVGGIAKGFTVEKIAAELKDSGLESGGISAGGNVKTIGQKNNNETWNVTVTDPRNNTYVAYDGVLTLAVKDDMSVVTSGDYFNYYLDNMGNKQHHIINPHTLKPGNLYHSVTIVCQDSGLADALSTALFNMSISEGEKLIKDVKEKYHCDVGVLWILSEENNEAIEDIEKNGLRIYMNDNFAQYLK